MQAYIPIIFKRMTKSSLPWLNEKCRSAIMCKHLCEGTSGYQHAVEQCRDTIRSVKKTYFENLKSKMETLPKSSKKWWALNKRLLHKHAAPALFPPIKDSSGQWHRSAETKANAFARCWAAKNKLPEEQFDHPFYPVKEGLPNSFIIRCRQVRSFLKKYSPRLSKAPTATSSGASSRARNSRRSLMA